MAINGVGVPEPLNDGNMPSDSQNTQDKNLTSIFDYDEDGDGTITVEEQSKVNRNIKIGAMIY